MGWNLNQRINETFRILGSRFITFYSTPDSLSAIGIIFHGELTLEEVDAVVDLFPEQIRVEFERLIIPEGILNLTDSHKLIGDALWGGETKDSKPYILKGQTVGYKFD